MKNARISIVVDMKVLAADIIADLVGYLQRIQRTKTQR